MVHLSVPPLLRPGVWAYVRPSVGQSLLILCSLFSLSLWKSLHGVLRSICASAGVHASPGLLPPDHDDSYSTIHLRSGARSIPDRTRSRAIDQTAESTLMDNGEEGSAHDSAASSDAEDEEDRLSDFLPSQLLHDHDQAGESDADVEQRGHAAKSAQARTQAQLEGERQLKQQAEARLRQVDAVANGRIRLEKAVDALVVRMDD